MLIWWHGAGGRVGTPHGVLRAAEVGELVAAHTVHVSARERADAVLAEAEARAEGLLAEARAQAEALLAEAQVRIAQACEDGRAEGEREAALVWHERQAGQAVAQVRAVHAMHERLADVVTTAVERIVHTEGRAALYQRALKSVQTLSRTATALTLRVSAADFEDARQGIAAVPELQAMDLAVEVVVDTALPPGSCIFESDIGRVDASLATQLGALRTAMARAVRRAVSE